MGGPAGSVDEAKQARGWLQQQLLSWREQSGQEEPAWRGKLELCRFCSLEPPLAAAPALLWLHSNITLGCRISAAHASTHPLSWEQGDFPSHSTSSVAADGGRRAKSVSRTAHKRGKKIIAW